MTLDPLLSNESLSNLLALIAIGISLYTFFRDKRTDKKNHEFDLFQDLYKEYLVKKLPFARANISITANGLVFGENLLINELHSIRKDSIYFKYTEPEYFEKLKEALWDLEDYLVMLDNPLVGEARVNFDYEINSRLEKIYKCILKKF